MAKYLCNYDNNFAFGGNGSDTTSGLHGEEEIRYFIEDVADLKHIRGAVSAAIHMVVYTDPSDNNNTKNIVALFGYDGPNATGNVVGVALPCPPYCGHEVGAQPMPAGMKMVFTAALIYLNGQPY